MAGSLSPKALAFHPNSFLARDLFGGTGRGGAGRGVAELLQLPHAREKERDILHCSKYVILWAARDTPIATGAILQTFMHRKVRRGALRCFAMLCSMVHCAAVLRGALRCFAHVITTFN